jgi:protein transport protein SEC23
VTSIQRNFDLNFPVVKETDCGFDQEAAILGLARLASNKFREKPNSEVIKWLDRSLVRFAKQFGSYKKGAPESFSLPSPMGLFPQFLYHLRRSAFVNALGMSPD